MFEVTTYLVPWFFTFPLAMIGAFLLLVSSIFLIGVPLESGKIASTLSVLSILMIVSGLFLSFPIDTETVDNPNSFIKISRNSIIADKDEIVKKIEEELNIQNVSFEQDEDTLAHLLVNGNGVNFMAVDGVKAIDGIIHFTDDEMVLTVFNEADETVVIPTR